MSVSSNKNNNKSLSRAFVVYRKEFRETFRDRRTLFNIVISPLFLTPMILALLGMVVGRQVKEAAAETLHIGIINLSAAPSLKETLKSPNIIFEPVTEAEAEARIKKRELRAAVLLPPDSQQKLTGMHTLPVKILVDSGSESSAKAAQRLESLFVERGQRVVAERLMANGLSSEIAIPFRTHQEPVAGGGSAATLILASFLPYVLAVSAILGGVYAANDSVAGEKERGTLETLLLSPASRRDIVLGKFFSVASVSLVSSFLSVVGLLWPFYTHLKMFDWLTQGGLSLRPSAVAAILLVQIPLAVLGSGLLLAVSTFARNQKEAQTYLAPILLAVSVSAMLSMLLKAESNWLYALFPVLNAALVLKQALEGTISTLFVVVACVSSLFYAALAVAFAVRLFEKESVLLKA